MGLNLEDILGDADFEMQCPGCDHEFSVKMGDILVEDAEVQCPACKANIKIQHDENVGNSLHDANSALADFERELKRLGK